MRRSTADSESRPDTEMCVESGAAVDFQRRGFVAAGQFHIGKQRPVATQSAPGAERVGQARLHCVAATVAGKRFRPVNQRITTLNTTVLDTSSTVHESSI